MSASIIKYKNKEIIFWNHRGLTGQDLMKSMKEGNDMVLRSNSNELLALADFRDALVGDDAWAFLKSPETKEVMKKIKKDALLGISGMKKILLNTYNALMGNKLKAFDTEEEAKEWLVK